jgi:photosystem II stability/assembly factor-like uncharacterized protein
MSGQYFDGCCEARVMRTATVGCLAALAAGCFALYSFDGLPSERLEGPPGAWAITVAPAPRSQNLILAALHGGGIARSTDGGETWTESNASLRERTVIPIAFDPVHPKIVYIGTEDGLFKSLDGGLRWQEISQGLTIRNVWSIIVDPALPSRVYAGTSGGGVFRSDDSGASWEPASKGIANPAIWPLALTRGGVYAGTLGSGVFRSSDHGASWSAVNQGLSNLRIMSLATATIKGRELIYAGTTAGLFRTENEGRVWTSVSGLEKEMVFSVQVESRGPEVRCYAGTGNGPFISDEHCGEWRHSQIPGDSQSVWSVAVQGRRIFAGTLGGGIVESDDGGAHWRLALRNPLHQLVYALAHDGTNLYAGTVGAGVWRSVNEGKSWIAANGGLSKRVVKALVIDPRDSQILYAGAEDQFMGGGGAVFRSPDRGVHWLQITPPELTRRIFSLALDPNRPGTLYAGADFGSIYGTSDGGATWAQIDAGRVMESESEMTVYQQSIHRRPVFALALDPRSPGIIFAATDGGVFKSTDRGKTWINSSNGLDDRRVRVLVNASANPDVLYAGCGDLGAGGAIFKSVDAGRTWERLGLANEWILSLVLDAADPNTIYAGTDRGLRMSRDGGKSWILLDGDPRSRYVLSLVQEPGKHTALFAGTEGNGIFRATTH